MIQFLSLLHFLTHKAWYSEIW